MANDYYTNQEPDDDGVFQVEGLKFNPTQDDPPSAVPTMESEVANISFDRNYRTDYGEFRDESSRYDEDITDLSKLQEGYNVNQLRGEVQPWYDKIGAGLVKGVGLAGTTFADGTLGTIAGALNVAANSSDIIDSDSPLRELGDSFISNPFSVVMQNINESIEKAIPNYYTKAEQEEPWQDHVFSANFIGDKFLKNLGFVVGAAYSGKVTAGAWSKLRGFKNIRNAFKGSVTTASGKVLNSADEIAKAYKSGDAFMDGVKITEDLAKAAKSLKNAEWELKLVGGTLGAMGEARIEAISNSKEWGNYHTELLNDQYGKELDDIEESLFDEFPEGFDFSLSDDGSYKHAISDPALQIEYDDRVATLDNKRDQALEELAKDKAKMANWIFGTNTVLLSASNIWQFGRFMSGGYTANRVTKNLVKGSIKEGFTAAKDIGLKEGAMALSSPLMEGQEEMTQSMISEAVGQKYSSELNDFYGAKINPEAEGEAIDWLNAIGQGFDGSYGKDGSWEEGFVGALTGLLGIPKVKMKSTSKGGRRPSISMGGEMAEGLRDAVNLRKEAKSTAEHVNKIIQDDKFKDYYQGTIRHNKFQKDMDGALDKGNPFDYKNAEHSQIVSDAIMFDKAGRIQDLYDIIDEGSTISDEDITAIRDNAVDKETGKSHFDGKTDQDVKDYVVKQAQDLKGKVDKYVEISNNLKTLYGDELADEHLEELTWAHTQIDDWEGRFKDLYEKNAEYAKSVVAARNKRATKEGEKTTEVLFGTNPEELLTVLDNKEVSRLFESEFKQEEDNKDATLKNKQFKTDLQDMFNIYSERKNLIDKLDAVSKNPALFGKAQEKANQAAYDEHVEQASVGLDDILGNVEDLNEFRAAIKDVDNEMLPGVYDKINKGDNAKLKKILKNDQDLTKATLNLKTIFSTLTPTPETAAANDFLQDILDKSNSVKDFKDKVSKEVLPDEIKRVVDTALDAFNKTNDAAKPNKPDVNKPKKRSLFDMAPVTSDPDAVPTDIPMEDQGPPVDAGVLEAQQQQGPPIDAGVIKEESSGADVAYIEMKRQKELKEISEFNNALIDAHGQRDTKYGITGHPSKPEVTLGTISDDISTHKIKTVEELELWREWKNALTGNDKSKAHKLKVKLATLVGKRIEADINAKYDAELEALKSKNGSVKEVDLNTPVHTDSSDTKVDQDKVSKSVDNVSNEGTLKSSYQTKYNLWALKDNQLVIRKNEIIEELNNLDTYGFVDRGDLGKVLNKYPNTEIHYVKSSNSDMASTIVLAIEATPEVLKLVGNIDSPFTGQDGKQYQAVGAMGYHSNDPESKADYENNIQELDLEESKFKVNNAVSDYYYVSPNLKTKVQHIFSGRMVTSTESEAQHYKPLNDFLDKNLRKNESAHFGVYYSGDIFKTPTLSDEDNDIVPINSLNSNPKEGSIWLMTKEADNRYYPKAVKVLKFSNKEYSLADNSEAPIVKDLTTYIGNIVDSKKTDTERASNLAEVKNILYFPEDSYNLHFNEESVYISKKGYDTIYNKKLSDFASKEEFVNDILNALQDDQLDLRFQITPSKLTEKSYVKDILASNIMETDLASLHNVGASFNMYMTNTAPEDVTVATGHTGVVEKVIRKTVMHSGERFTIYANKTIEDSKGVKVTHPDKMSEIVLMANISEGKLKPIKGSTNLYIGVYGSGVKFGIVNNKVYKGHPLNVIYNKAKKIEAKWKREEAEKEVLEKEKLMESTKISVEKPSLFSMTKGAMEREIAAKEGDPFAEVAKPKMKATDISKIEYRRKVALEGLVQHGRNEPGKAYSWEVAYHYNKKNAEEADIAYWKDKLIAYNTDKELAIEIINKKYDDEITTLSKLKSAELKADKPAIKKKPVNLASEKSSVEKINFVKSLQVSEKKTNFASIITTNRSLLRELNVKNLKEFETLAKDKNVDLSTISSTSDLINAIEIIKNCR